MATPLSAILVAISFNVISVGHVPEALYGGMKWRLVGPFRGGRSPAVTGVPNDPLTYYFGGAGGGVWKSVNGGWDWAPIFDQQSSLAIGALAIAPSNPNVIYAGTGEACIRGNVDHGDGVYRSTDAGRTWKNVGLRDSRHIGAITVHPSNPEIAFVAALGHLYGPSQERGIFRTVDGGRTWTKVLFKDDKTGGISVLFDPNDPDVLFAALWQVYRTPYSLEDGGPGSGLYRSSDGGVTWKRLDGNGLPSGIAGRIGVTIAPSDSSRIYAMIEAESGGLFRSDDHGEHWEKVNDDQRFRQRAWYFNHVFADPRNADVVYALNTGLFRSSDGGKTFALLPAPHGDHHSLWIDPTNPSRMIDGNDGGATISTDGGHTWTRQDNQPTAQYYHVVADNEFPYHLFGAQQDNNTIEISTMSEDGVITRADWFDVSSGESGTVAPDPRNPNVTYTDNAGGYIVRYDNHTKQGQDISIWPLDLSGWGAESYPHRFQWTEPLFLSPHDPSILYTAGEAVFASRDEGMTWKVLSPDLTRNDKTRQRPSGGPITKDNTGVEVYDTIFALAESPRQKGLLWAGSDDGLVHVTQDGGGHWANVTPKGIPEWSKVSTIEPSPHDARTAYIALDRHRLDDNRPYALKTADMGKTWTSLAKSLPSSTYVYAVREDPKKKGLLYAGTDNGIFVSFDDGASWQSLQLNLPRAPIHDLIIKDDDLAVATHGRAFSILDDIAPLRELAAGLAQAPFILYKPRPQVRLRFPEEINRRRPVGDNPPSGAIIDYYLATEPKDEITLEFLDDAGKLVRKLSSKEKKKMEQPPEWPDQEAPVAIIPAKAGMNRFAWNMRWESPIDTPAYYPDNGPLGPIALPGKYRVRLTVAGKSATVPLEIKADPRVKTPVDDLKNGFDLAMKIRDRISELHVAMNQIKDLRVQLGIVKHRFESEKLTGKKIVDTVARIENKMRSVEERLYQTRVKSSEGTLNFPTMLNEQLNAFRGTVESADTAPTAPAIEVFQVLSKQLDTELAHWKEVAPEITALNDLIRKSEAPLVVIPAGDTAEVASERPDAPVGGTQR